MKSQKRVHSPACLSITSGREGIELVAVVLLSTAGVAEAIACGCEDGWV
jgi:hypothetical protein